jgi:hypothetical protein
MGLPDFSILKPPGCFQHNCCQWAVFLEMLSYTSLLFLEKSLPDEWWWQDFLETQPP